MNVHVHNKRRSIQSVFFEMLLKLLNRKKNFASVFPYTMNEESIT